MHKITIRIDGREYTYRGKLTGQAELAHFGLRVRSQNAANAAKYGGNASDPLEAADQQMRLHGMWRDTGEEGGA